jgi:hypothetical protein
MPPNQILLSCSVGGNEVTSRPRSDLATKCLLPGSCYPMNEEHATQNGDYSDYCFHSSWDGDGQISDEENKPLWRYKSIGGNPFHSSVYGFFRLPVFVVQDLEGHELLAFKRIKRFPLSVFEVKEGNRLVGRIRQRSFLFTKYILEFETGLRCTFHMPFFTVWFRGVSETGGHILVRLRQHRAWLVRLDSNINSLYLVAALAFIHRERLRHG